MENYQEAADYLGLKNERPAPYGSPRGTTVTRLSDDEIAVQYHGTNVVTYHSNGFVVLNSRDATGKAWRSATTKSRLNDYSPATVIQRERDWFVVDKNNHREPFIDGFTVGNDGYPLRDRHGDVVLEAAFEAVSV